MAVNNKGMISQMDTLSVVTGDEFLEVVARDSQGRLKNFKVLARNLRSTAGLSAYEVAVANGFIGTETEWLESLHGGDGVSAYDVALEEGFVGTAEEWLASLKGTDGIDGMSAYESALASGFTGTVVEWLESLQGPKGDQGDNLTAEGLQALLNLRDYEVKSKLRVTGTNSGVVTNAVFANFLMLFDKRLDNVDNSSPDKVPQRATEMGRMETEGYSYWKIAGAPSNDGRLSDVAQEIRMYDEGQLQFGSMQAYIQFDGSSKITVVNAGVSKEFDLATTLEPGKDGKSAYELAVDGGFVGTLEEWLQSLVGPQGETGLQGEAGESGVDGLSAYDIAVVDGFVGTAEEWLESLKGPQGEAGEAGQDGTVGVDGKSAYEIAVADGFVGTEAEWLESLKGPQGEAGVNGKSAFDLAVEEGFVGTEAEWLESLKGEDGLSAYAIAVEQGFDGGIDVWLESLKGEPGAEGVNGTDGKSAYELAIDEGFVGTLEEWLQSLVGPEGVDGKDGQQGVDGLSAYALAVEEGFEGDIEEWLESLKGEAGLSAFEAAVAGGYTGTEEEFNTSLSNIGDDDVSGVSGAVFITDVQPEDVNENTGNKVKSEDSFSLVSCESTTNDVKVHVTAVTGNTNYRPNVTVNDTAVRLIAGEIPLLWKGIVSITLPAGGQSVINAKHEDGAKSQATVTMTSAPVVTSAFFEAVYPDDQTEFKAGDKVSVTFTADTNVISYEIKNEGALVASTGNVTAGNTHTVTNLSVADRGDTAQMLPFSIRVKEASGAWSEWYKSDIEGDTDAVNVINLNNLKPVVTIGTVEYPVGQTALKEGNTAIVNNTVSNFTTVTYSSVGGQLTITDPTVSEAAKMVTCNTSAYNDSTNNLTITATRAENGSTTTVSTVVKVASEAPTLAITLPAARLRSGGNLGTSVQNHVITLTSNQALVEAPSLTVPSGTLIGTWTPNPARTVWKRSIAIHDDDAKGVFSFGDISAVGPAGIEATSVTTGATYTIGGFVLRRMSIDAYPVRSAAMGVIVTDVTKLRCSNLSKGGVGSNNFTYQATQDEAVDRYTIINDNEWYNCDGGNATSNTSGVMKVDIEELA